MAKADLRPVCTYKVEKKIGNFITQSNAIVLEMGASSYFALPPIPFATVTINIGLLQTAETLAKTKAAGAASARDIKYEVVLTNMRRYQNFVQQLADAAPDRLTAIAIIDASGFGLRVTGVKVKPPL